MDEEDQELKDDYNGEDSEKGADEGAEGEEGAKTAAGAVAEADEGGWGSEEEDELALLIATGQVETYYSGEL